MRILIPLLSTALVLGFTGCAGDDDAEDQPENVAPAAETPVLAPAPATPPGPEAVMRAPIMAEGGSTAGGEVQILPPSTPTDGFRLTGQFTGLPAGEHAWHIHASKCGVTGSPVVVPFTADKDKPGLASPLTAGADGKLVVDVAVPANLLTVDQLRAGDYSLHVHTKGGDDHGPTIACADL